MTDKRHSDLKRLQEETRESDVYFKLEEFECKCGCGTNEVHPLLVRLLNEIRRDHYHDPIVVTSGLRCAVHNAKVGGATDSKHLHGFAADLLIPTPWGRGLIVEACRKVKMARIFFYASKPHVHVDIGEGRRDDTVIYIKR